MTHLSVRIKGRLKNLIARRPQVELLKKTGIMQGTYYLFIYLLIN